SRTGRDPEAIKAEWAARIPAGRYGTPEEFAVAIVFLASQQASFITGVHLGVDGGQINTLL
ncbi:MAG TPA: SDR family oxidoreductase, partial [Symbiobacteriaceae bacterium]|nr:SDR family oxidoreductase [Symbiobacteriaceae bacterium]